MKTELPIDSHLPQILAAFTKNQMLVLTAAPGTGKTTRLPPALLSLCSKKILVLEPRRVAAIAAATRIAAENNWQVGQEVGWQVRFDNQTSEKSRIIFMTEALLARRMLSDPSLKDIDLIVLDEFHERSLYTDITLGLLKELIEMGSPIKILIMSATLQAEKISQYLKNAEIISVPGQTQPLEVLYQKEPLKLNTGPDFINRVSNAIRDTALARTKDLLVFLPGTGEIQRVLEKLSEASWANPFEVIPLHGRMSLREQSLALMPSKGRRRIILSTNLAESSITVNGVDAVIDSGIARQSRFDIQTGFSRLELSRISLQSAQQRAGRSARQFPGQCLRLWNKQDELSMSTETLAEIHRSDLSEAFLLLSHHGIRHFRSFSWFDPPPEAMIQGAENSLRLMGALNQQNELTPLGKKLLRYPTHPQIAALLELGAESGAVKETARLAAFLQENDFLREEQIRLHLAENWECDAHLRLALFDVAPQTIQESARQMERIAAQGPSQKVDLHALILKAFAAKLCRRRSQPNGPTNRGVMIGGRGVELSPLSVVQKSEFFIALHAREIDGGTNTRVEWACGISKNLLLATLAEQIVPKKKIVWDEARGQFYLETARYIGDLAIEEPNRSIATHEMVAENLPSLCADRFDEILKKNLKLFQWVQRWRYWEANPTGHAVPPLSSFLNLAIQDACHGEQSFHNICDKDLVGYFENHIERSLLKNFEQDIPGSLLAPSGQRHPIQYPLDLAAPFLEIRLQEVFGWKENPKIRSGKTSLVLHLLAPNHRPVQVTSDLGNFWKTGYEEVRKELRARYPKHSWPEDPLTAQATHKAIRRR